MDFQWRFKKKQLFSRVVSIICVFSLISNSNLWPGAALIPFLVRKFILAVISGTSWRFKGGLSSLAKHFNLGVLLQTKAKLMAFVNSSL